MANKEIYTFVDTWANLVTKLAKKMRGIMSDAPYSWVYRDNTTNGKLHQVANQKSYDPVTDTWDNEDPQFGEVSCEGINGIGSNPMIVRVDGIDMITAEATTPSITITPDGGDNQIVVGTDGITVKAGGVNQIQLDGVTALVSNNGTTGVTVANGYSKVDGNLGIDMVPVNKLDARKDQVGITTCKFDNQENTSGAGSSFELGAYSNQLFLEALWTMQNRLYSQRAFTLQGLAGININPGTKTIFSDPLVWNDLNSVGAGNVSSGSPTSIDTAGYNAIEVKPTATNYYTLSATSAVLGQIIDVMNIDASQVAYIQGAGGYIVVTPLTGRRFRMSTLSPAAPGWLPI